MNKLVAVLVLVGLIVGGYIYLRQPEPAEETSTTSTDVDARLAQYQGKVVLLDFWATWCGPCKAAMPGVQRISEKFAGQPVAVVGVNCWERGDPAAFMEQHGYTYELMLNGNQLAKEYNVDGIPTFVILSPTGEMLYRKSGYNPRHEQEIARIITEQLEKM